MSDKEDAEKYVGSVTQQECEIAENALLEFNKGNYSNCLQQLNKLESRTFDFKVAHNKIVVDYYKSELKKTDVFQKNLSNLFNQFNMRIEKLDDVDHCVAHYNQAIIHYHNKHYTQTLRIMERVYKFIEPMDENLAKQVGLSLVELLLSIKQLDKAMTLLTYLENHFGVTNPVILLKGGKQGGKEQADKKSLNVAAETFKRKLVTYKARCFLMNHSVESFKKEIALLQNLKSPSYLFLMANWEYLNGNYKECMKILDDVPTDVLSYNEHGESSCVMKHNNLAAVYHSMGKFNLAAHYFHQALKEDTKFYQNAPKYSSDDRPLYVIGGSRYHEIVYNLGISLLHAGKPAQAFECLTIAVRRYHRNSRLWLRLAECCIAANKQSNEIDFDIQKKQKEMVVEVIGGKLNKKVILTKSLSSDKKYSTEPVSYAVPVPSLEFASLCLRNAYNLLPSDTATSPVPLLLIPGVTPPAPPLSPGPAPSSSLSPGSVATLKNSIAAASAYVALCLGDYVLALEHARNLLSQPKISGVHRLLGHLYSAEALVLMDNITDALEHLNPENLKDVSLQIPDESDNEIIKNNPPATWFPTNLDSVHAVLQYNIAVCKTIRGQLDQASALLKQIWQSQAPNCRVPAHIIMLVLYIELQLGHADVARSLVKQYCFQSRIDS